MASWSRSAAVVVASAVSQLAPAPQVSRTRYGAQIEPLVESYYKDADGAVIAGANAWPMLVEAAELCHEVLDKMDAGPTGQCLKDAARSELEMGATVRARATLLLYEMQRRGLFERLDRIAAERIFVRPSQPGDILQWELGPLGDIRQIARVSVVRMRLAAERGDGPAAVRSFRHALALARAVAHQFTLLDRLVGLAVLDLAINELRFEVAEGRWRDRGTLLGFAEAMDEFLPLPSPSLAFEGERLSALDAVRAVYEGREGTFLERLSRLGSNEEQPGHEVAPQVRLLAAQGVATESEAQEFIEALFARMIAATRLPAMEMIAEGERIHADINAAQNRHAVAKIVVPGVRKAMAALAQSDAGVVGTRAVLALELHRAEVGDYPESLGALIPRYLRDAPLDVYTREPLVYRVLKPDPQDPRRRYVLYSVGYDLTDNGGTPHPKTPAAATNSSGAGYDFQYTTLRAPAQE
jgi:hypothetical protein